MKQKKTDLGWYLSKVVDEPDSGVENERVVDGLEVYVALVEKVVEDIVGLFGRRSRLSVPEDQIDPLV